MVYLKVIIKIVKYIRSFLSEICLFESKKNKKKISFRNLTLLKYSKFDSIKNKNLKKYVKLSKKNKRFNNNHNLFALFLKNDLVCVGWMYVGRMWHITEIDCKIHIKNKILLYDFFTFEKFRNRGFYSKILILIKNLKTNKNFLIYCLSNNKASKRGIENSKFILLKKIRRNV